MSMTTELELVQREKFEAWAEECCALPWGYLKKRRTYSGHYSEHTYTSLWAAWKAACEGMAEALEARDKQIAQQREYYEGVIADGSQRIAELEESHAQVIQSRYNYKRMSEEGLKSIREARAHTEKRIEELHISRDKCFLSGLKTGWQYGIADDTEGYNREIADAQAVIDRAAGVAVEGE